MDEILIRRLGMSYLHLLFSWQRCWQAQTHRTSKKRLHQRLKNRNGISSSRRLSVASVEGPSSPSAVVNVPTRDWGTSKIRVNLPRWRETNKGCVSARPDARCCFRTFPGSQPSNPGSIGGFHEASSGQASISIELRGAVLCVCFDMG